MDGSDYLFVDGSGNVDTQPTPIEINAPKGWADTDISYERGWTYYGLFRQYSEPYQFVKEAAKIVRWAYYISKGVEKVLTLQIWAFNYTLAVRDYELLTSCEVDLSTIVDSYDFVEAALIEGGFISKLKAREDSTYEIDVQNNADVVWVKMHGIKLHCILNWVVTGSEATSFTDIFLPQTDFYATDGINTQLTPLSVDQLNAQSRFLLNLSGSSVDIEVLSKLNFNVLMDPANTVDGELRVVLQLTSFFPQAIISNIVIYTQGSLAPGSTTYISLDQIDTLTFDNNRALELHLIVDDGGGGGGTNDYQIDMLQCPGLKVRFFNSVPVGYIPALKPYTVYQSLIDQISDSTTNPTSGLLNATHQDKVITSGDALRNLDNSKMKISFKDFYQSINSVFSAGLYYDKDADEVILEGKDTFFDNTQIGDLGPVTNFKAKPLSSEMFGKLKAGFGSYTYDEINGKDEFNLTTEFQLPITKVKNEKDLTSVIRADMYGIEYTRLNLGGKESTDADTDNDNFFIHIDYSSTGVIPDGFPGAGSVYYDIYRKPLDSTPGTGYWDIQNITFPDTAFNIFFSAKRQLQRWAGYLSGILYLLSSEFIKFQTKTKTNEDATAMITEEGATPDVIDEAIEEQVSNYGDPLFLPILFEVEIAAPTSLNALITAAPHGYVRFEYKGNEFFGFIIKATVKPTLPMVQTYTLLASPNNDLSKIVYPT